MTCQCAVITQNGETCATILREHLVYPRHLLYINTRVKIWWKSVGVWLQSRHQRKISRRPPSAQCPSATGMGLANRTSLVSRRRQNESGNSTKTPPRITWAEAKRPKETSSRGVEPYSLPVPRKSHSNCSWTTRITNSRHRPPTYHQSSVFWAPDLQKIDDQWSIKG